MPNATREPRPRGRTPEDRSAYPVGIETTAIPVLPPDSRTRKRFIGTVAVLAAIGGALFGYDTGVISGALLYVSPDFHLSSDQEGVVTSILLIGAAAGALFGGRVADRIGRRPTIIVAGIVFIIGALGSALAPDYAVLSISRLVLGVAVGVSSILVPMYIAEMAPAEVRGRMVSLNSLMIVGGQLLAYVVNALLAHAEAWRWMLGLAGVPAVVLVIGMFFLPDTPSFYQKHGHPEKALAVLRRGHTERDAHRELRSIRETQEAQSESNQGWRGFRQGWVRKAVLIAIGIAVLQQITGVNSVIYFAPTLLVKAGLPSSTAVIASIAVGVVSVLATVVGLRLVDRVSRRKLLIIGSLCGVASLIALGVVYPFSANGTGFAYLTLGMMVLFLAFQQSTVSTTTWLIMSELVPSSVRGIGMGVVGLFLWIANFAVALLFLPVVQAIGGAFTFWGFAAIGVLGALFVWKLVPETGGKSLEDIEHELQDA